MHRAAHTPLVALALAVLVIASGCGLSLDLDPEPRPVSKIDASVARMDSGSGTPDAGGIPEDASIADSGATDAPAADDAGDPPCRDSTARCVPGIAGSFPDPTACTSGPMIAVTFMWSGLTAYEGHAVEIALTRARDGLLVGLRRARVSSGSASVSFGPIAERCVTYVIDGMLDIEGHPEVCDPRDITIRSTVSADASTPIISTGEVGIDRTTDAPCPCFPIYGDLDVNGCVDRNDGCVLGQIVTGLRPADPRGDLNDDRRVDNFDTDPLLMRIRKVPVVCGRCILICE